MVSPHSTLKITNFPLYIFNLNSLFRMASLCYKSRHVVKKQRRNLLLLPAVAKVVVFVHFSAEDAHFDRPCGSFTSERASPPLLNSLVFPQKSRALTTKKNWEHLTPEERTSSHPSDASSAHAVIKKVWVKQLCFGNNWGPVYTMWTMFFKSKFLYTSRV